MIHGDRLILMISDVVRNYVRRMPVGYAPRIAFIPNSCMWLLIDVMNTSHVEHVSPTQPAISHFIDKLPVEFHFYMPSIIALHFDDDFLRWYVSGIYGVCTCGERWLMGMGRESLADGEFINLTRKCRTLSLICMLSLFVILMRPTCVWFVVDLYSYR